MMNPHSPVTRAATPQSSTPSPLSQDAATPGQRTARPPGPRTFGPLGSARPFRRNPLGFLTDLASQYGDVATFRLATQRIYFVNHPDGVQRILLDRWRAYDKDVVWFGVLRFLVGEGLATVSDPDRWVRRRRLMQPLFHRKHLDVLGPLVADTVRSRDDVWQARARDGVSIDISDEMTQISLRVLCQAIFRMDSVDARYHRLTDAFAAVNQGLADYFHLPFPPITWRRRLRAERGAVDAIIASFIQEHRREGDRDDVLTLLLGARDEETGEPLNDRDVRDEVITFLVGGHETTAVTLAWTCCELARRPDVDRRLYEEAMSVLGDRDATVDDVPRLPYARAVMDETLRLYPPIWQMMRHATEEDEVCGYRVPAGTAMMWSPYTLQRHPAFWPDPDRFDPDRFHPAQQTDQRALARRRAYAPFGSGPRTCIGMHFALTEAVLVLANVMRRFRFALSAPDRVEPAPFITLRPRFGVGVRIFAR